MKRITDNTGFKKGDIITKIEYGCMWDPATQTYPQQDWTLKFEIVRVNKKTYGCKYVEGYMNGSGFNWTKNSEIQQSNVNHEYYF